MNVPCAPLPLNCPCFDIFSPAFLPVSPFWRSAFDVHFSQGNFLITSVLRSLSRLFFFIAFPSFLLVPYFFVCSVFPLSFFSGGLFFLWPWQEIFPSLMLPSPLRFFSDILLTPLQCCANVIALCLFLFGFVRFLPSSSFLLVQFPHSGLCFRCVT